MKRKFVWHLIMICGVVLISLALLKASRLSAQNSDFTALATIPSESVYFSLELEGEEIEKYDTCLGLGSSNNIVETVVYEPGGTPRQEMAGENEMGSFIQKTPGRLEWHNITLKRTGPSSSLIVSWRGQLESERFERVFREGAIVMYWSGFSEPIAKWTFRRGWPAKLVLNGTQEELVIVHEGLQREFVPSDGGGVGR